MVCKELDELCAKFSSLSPHLRIDYIYGMLRMCLPPELRFIGSVVEDLAKKDFNHLREHENKANNQMELMKYQIEDEKTLLEGMAFNLSLLHSVNTACANIIFSLLKEKSKTVFHITSATDSKTIDIILLVLTMAKYHPAFTFHQRSEFAEFYRTVEQQLHNICTKTNHSTTAPAPSLSQQHMTFTKVSHSLSHDRGPVESLRIKHNFLIGTDQKPMFPIQVMWENGDVSEITKSYQDIQDFCNKICQQFPEQDNDEGLNEIIRIVTAQAPGTTDLIQQQVHSLINFLSGLPKHMKDSEQFKQFCHLESRSQGNLLYHTVPLGYGATQEMDNFGFGDMVNSLPPVATVQPFTESEFRSPDSSGNQSLNNSRSTSPDTEPTIQNSPQSKKTPETFKHQQSPNMTMDEVKRNKMADTRVTVLPEEKPREKGHDRLLNGMVEHPSYMFQQMYLHPPPQPMYQIGVPYQYQHNMIVSREASSSGNSSPSYSPVPQKKPPMRGGDSSSDDSEKGGNLASQGLEDEVGEASPPPTQRSVMDNMGGCGNNSGYQSDPTPTQGVRFFLPNNAFKAPPTRGNGLMPNKNVVNMPDVVAGRHFPYGIPIVRHDFHGNTASSAASQHGQRPVIHALNPASIRSPPINSSGHNNTFLCSVTSSAHSLMATNQQNGINSKRSMNSTASEPIISNIQRIDSRTEIASSTSSPVSNGNPEVNGPGYYNQTSCTSCGCTGRHNIPTYQYHQVPNQYLPNHMMAPHYMNGMVPHLPFYHQFQYPMNGIPPNYIQPLSHYQLSNFPTPQYGFPMVVQRRNSASHTIGKPPRTSSVTCSNCGSTDHISTECRENSMESMSGSFQLKYDPKSNSD